MSTALTLTFVIPTYGGLSQLQKYLPSVLKQAQTGDTILISDDLVSDRANVDYWRRQYHLSLQEVAVGQLWVGTVKSTGKTITLKFLHRARNARFARNVNEAVDLVTDDFFILLNDDVKLQSGVRSALMKTITNSPAIFGVGAKELDAQAGGQVSGRNKLWWHRGRFWHARASANDLSHSGETAWVCGGSGIFRTRLWRELKGFDERFYPAYWEDIDLSHRARKQGYQVLYEPKAVVEHIHETTNTSVFGAAQMKEMSWRGGTRFSWKHTSFWQKIQLLLFYPWWSVKQYPSLKWWYVIILMALALRLSLINMPAGLTVDEAAIGYNGWSLITARRDEWLNRLPLSVQSFGDYKAPLAIYVNGLFTTILGLEIWTIRLPFVLAGVASIWLMMLIAQLLIGKHYPGSRWAGLVVGVLLTTLPWHLHFSHLGFENNFALLFSLAGFYFFLRFIHLTPPRRGGYNLVLTALWWSLALYSYHSAKVTLPLIGLGLLIYYRRQLWQRWRAVLVALVVGGLLVAPLIYDGLYGEGLTRAGTAFFMQPDLTASEKMMLWGQGWLAHFTPAYLWGGQVNTATGFGEELVPNVRHGDGSYGILSLGVSALIIVLAMMVVRNKKIRQQNHELLFLSCWWILAGVLPATLTTSVPHSNQALLAIPGFMLLAAGGFAVWPKGSGKMVEFSRSLRYLAVVLAGLMVFPWYHTYLQVFAPVRSSEPLPVSAHLSTRQQAVDYLFATDLIEILRDAWGKRQQVSQIVISTGREHEYIYALVASGISPLSYQGGLLSSKILYLPKLNDGDWERANTIIIVDGAQWQARDSSQLPTASEITHYAHASAVTDLYVITNP